MLKLERHGPQVLVLPAKPQHSPGPCLTQPRMDILHLWQAHAHAAKADMMKLNRHYFRQLYSPRDAEPASIWSTVQKANRSIELMPAVKKAE